MENSTPCQHGIQPDVGAQFDVDQSGEVQHEVGEHAVQQSEHSVVDVEHLVQSWQLAAFDHEYGGEQYGDLGVVS